VNGPTSSKDFETTVAREGNAIESVCLYIRASVELSLSCLLTALTYLNKGKDRNVSPSTVSFEQIYLLLVYYPTGSNPQYSAVKPIGINQLLSTL